MQQMQGSVQLRTPLPGQALVPPATMEKETPKGRDEAGMWFAYGKKWYCVAIKDLDGKKTIKPKSKVRMRISWFNLHGKLETETQTLNAQLQSGGYWFHDVRPFQFGEYRLTFECTTDPATIAPLVCSIRVDPPDGVTPPSPAPFVEEVPVLSPARKRRQSVSGESFVHLAWAERLDRQAPGLELDGQLQAIVLPHSLKAALLDNREAIMLRGAMPPLPSTASCRSIVRKVARAAKMPKEVSDDIRDRLLVAFDALLEMALLYPEERAEHQRVAEQLIVQDQRFADIYGPVHLLRLLVLLTQAPTLSLLEGDEAPAEASGSKRRRELGKKHDDAATDALHKLVQDLLMDMDENLDLYFGVENNITPEAQIPPSRA